jgi:N-acetylneuraminic acid mutarotase
MIKILRPQNVLLLLLSSVLILNFTYKTNNVKTNHKTSSFETPVWSSGTNIPIPVRAGNTASYSKNGQSWLYIVSGRNSSEAIITTVQRYNLNTNSWDTLAQHHPTGLLGGATAVLGDSLYIVGGVINPPGSGITTVHKYSINQDAWSTATSFPAGIVDAKAVSYQDSIIYVGGGLSGLSSAGLVYLYNAKSNQWRAATPFPSATRRNFGGFAITGDTIIYMCGTAAFGSGQYYDSVYVGVISQSDRANITWTRGANFPGQTRTFFDAHAWGSRGIIMTGGSTDNTFNTNSNECYMFSPGANTWTQLPDKPTSWLTGQSGTVNMENNIWKLICASGYASSYLSVNEILSDTLNPIGILNYNNEIPEKFTLEQNYPNPFNPETTINFKIPTAGNVRIIIHNIQGKEVETAHNGYLAAGSYELKWLASGFASGIYFYTLEAEKFRDTKKMVLMK